MNITFSHVGFLLNAFTDLCIYNYYVQKYAGRNLHVFACMLCTCMHIHTYVHMYMYTCAYVHIYSHMHIRTLFAGMHELYEHVDNYTNV